MDKEEEKEADDSFVKILKAQLLIGALGFPSWWLSMEVGLMLEGYFQGARGLMSQPCDTNLFFRRWGDEFPSIYEKKSKIQKKF